MSVHSTAQLEKARDLSVLRTAERGSAIPWALLFITIITGMVIYHAGFLAANRRMGDVQNRLTPLASSFADSGLTDALSWFTKQETQPVPVFDPQLDPAADPPVLDTLDPRIGLVREFEVRGKLWGRYEVRKSSTIDISKESGMSASGSVWDVGSIGMLYERVDPKKAYNEYPNRIISRTSMRTEIRGIPMTPPAPAAIGVTDPETISILPGGKVLGGDKPAFSYPPTTDPTNEVMPVPGVITGTPTTVELANFDSSAEKVFKMSLYKLKEFANLVVPSVDGLPEEIRNDRVVFVNGDLNLAAGRRQRGRMLLIVNGSLIADNGNDTDIEGLVFVTGDASLGGGFKLKGSMLVKGSFAIGGGIQAAQVSYDQSAIDALKSALSRYRASRSRRLVDQTASSLEELTAEAAPELGVNVKIDSTAMLGAGISLGDNSEVKEFTSISPDVMIEDDVRINKECSIGYGVTIGQQSFIDDYSHVGDRAQIGQNVQIGKSCQVGAGATVMDGAVVPDGTVVPAGMTYMPGGVIK
ncbi:MAG: LbetaH domain-containing protein [Planctomycetota bacterium]|jgi:acyl-[acyl carrier protein]--UDP-N-acetylglucosamine O-acyltransferase